MYLVRDVRETRVWQDAFKEGLEIGRKEGLETGRKEGIEQGRAIVRLAAENKSAEEIAAVVQVDIEFVRSALSELAQETR